MLKFRREARPSTAGIYGRRAAPADEQRRAAPGQDGGPGLQGQPRHRVGGGRVQGAGARAPIGLRSTFKDAKDSSKDSKKDDKGKDAKKDDKKDDKGKKDDKKVTGQKDAKAKVLTGAVEP